MVYPDEEHDQDLATAKRLAASLLESAGKEGVYYPQKSVNRRRSDSKTP